MSKFVSNLDDEALRALVEALTESGQAVSIFDAADNLRYANKTYHGMFLGDYDGPFTFTDILRHAHRNGLGVRIDDNDVEAFIARTLARRRSVPRKSFETDLVDGRWFWMDHTILPNGWVLSVGADITALKQNEKSLRQAHEVALQASRTDLLTGLPNRRYILEQLDQALAEHEATGSNLCIAVIDIDRFKAINDGYGHDAGDPFSAISPTSAARGCGRRMSLAGWAARNSCCFSPMPDPATPPASSGGSGTASLRPG
jgi:PAS domain-containing protein